MIISLLRQSSTHRVNAALISLATLISFTGCVIDQEEADPSNPSPGDTCLAAPTCGPDQEEVDSCSEESDLPCQEVTICNQTIYCMETSTMCVQYDVACPGSSIPVDSCEGAVGPCSSIDTGCGFIYCEEEEFCDQEPPICDRHQIEVDTCDGANEICYEYSSCSGTVYCIDDGFACEVPPPECPDDTVEVDHCDDEESGCFLFFEESECYSPVYCAYTDLLCNAFPSCASDEIESLDPCAEDEESCRPSTDCGSTIYCRPGTTTEVVVLNACEPMSTLPADGFDMNDALIEGDELVLSVSYGGGCEEHIFAGCFSHFTEIEPYMVNIQVGHDSQGDPCRGIMSEERRFSLEILKTVYQSAFGVEQGVINVNLEGLSAPLEYEFN